MNDQRQSMSLLELQEDLQALISQFGRGIWVTAELSDVRERGPHCYMELIQKDSSTGQTVAKARATIWANVWKGLKYNFLRATGQPFASGLTVMVRVNAEYHPLYGMNLNIIDVDPAYTMGERERRRQEILKRLEKEGVINLNKELDLPEPCLRIAIISAPGAAGFGDFINQLLLNNPRQIAFRPELFPALMQGAGVSASVRGQLDRIAQRMDDFDCVCIIRGGGASTDLDGFDDYELAANVAQFPLPVIVGIGHERDTTVLDFICAERVKTPTAAAELLASRAGALLDDLKMAAGSILRTVTDLVGDSRQQLAYLDGQVRNIPLQAIERAGRRLDHATLTLGQAGRNRIMPMFSRLDRAADMLKTVSANRIALAGQNLQSAEALLAALSPQAVLNRGFSIARVKGKAVRSYAEVNPGDIITIQLASGELETQNLKKY